MNQPNNQYFDKQNNHSSTYFIDWVVYSLIFFLILLPFIEHGWLKIGSVALILGFFAGFLNRFFREYYAFRGEDHSKVGKINQVTGEQHNPEVYFKDYEPHYTNRSIPDKNYKSPQD